MYVDSHAHLDDKKFDGDRDETIRRAKEAGVAIILNVGESIASSKAAIAYAAQYDFIYASVGIHPHHAAKVSLDAIEQVRTLSREKKVLAIGEIGLDYYYDFSPKKKQLELFEAQLIVAKEEKKPIIIHNRDSEEDCIKLLTDIYPGQIRGVMHCFCGNVAFAKQCLELGLMISFSGIATFPKAQSLAQVVREVPLEKMLIETDCPYLAPQEKRGKRNEPAYVTYTAQKIAEIKELSVQEVASITTSNTKDLFGIE